MQQPEERPDDRSTDRPDGERDAREQPDRTESEPEPGRETESGAESGAEPEREPDPGETSGSTAEGETGRPDHDDAGADRLDSPATDTATGRPDGHDDSDDGSGTTPDDGSGDERDERDERETPHGETEPEPAGTPRPRDSRGGWATAATVLGELLITAGVVLGLFVAYTLWWTNVVANQEAQRDSDAIRDAWAQPPPEDEAEGREYDADAEDGVGFLHVPAMSGDEILVKEGVDLDILNGGVAGLYDDPVESAMPWDEEGNVSLAAHRDGHGAKFHHIDRLDDGDAIVFETRDTWYVYRVYATLPETSPRNTAVLDPVPDQSGVDEAGQYLTLTTCTPVYSSAYRYIVWGELERTEDVDEQRTPPPELAED